MKKLRDALVTGLLVLVPLVATIQILFWFFNSIDNNLRGLFPSFLWKIDFRGLGILLGLSLLLIVGTLTQIYAGKWLLNILDKGISTIPLVGNIYSGIKKFLETVFNPNTEQFHGTVLVQFPREGIYSIGFRTGKPDSHLQAKLAKPMTNVFVPCTPNPTSGFYLLVAEAELIPLELSVQEAFKIVISMGIVNTEGSHK